MEEDLSEFLSCTVFKPLYVWVCTATHKEGAGRIKIGHQLALSYFERNFKLRQDIQSFLSQSENEIPEEYKNHSERLRRPSNLVFLTELLEFEKMHNCNFRYLTFHTNLEYTSVYDDQIYETKIVMQVELNSQKIISYQLSFVPRSKNNIFANSLVDDVKYFNDNLNQYFIQQLYDRYIERLQ